jgi:hypothetical protein
MHRLCTLRKLAVSVLPALTLLVGGSSTSMAASGTTHVTVRETVSWSMSPARCSSLQVDLTGTGERLSETNTKVNADGSMQILINDLVTGTASDSTGTYHFVYHNHSVQTIPPAGAPIHVEMADIFVLNGNGSAGHLSVGFNWRWTYTPPDPFVPPDFPIFPAAYHLQPISTQGDVRCDPI